MNVNNVGTHASNWNDWINHNFRIGIDSAHIAVWCGPWKRKCTLPIWIFKWVIDSEHFHFFLHQVQYCQLYRIEYAFSHIFSYDLWSIRLSTYSWVAQSDPSQLVDPEILNRYRFGDDASCISRVWLWTWGYFGLDFSPRNTICHNFFRLPTRVNRGMWTTLFTNG